MRNLEVRIRRIPVTAMDDLEVVAGEVPRVTRGGFLCRAHWLAVDPFACLPAGDATTASSSGARPGEIVPALGVCEVLESRHDVFAAGQLVVLEGSVSV